LKYIPVLDFNVTKGGGGVKKKVASSSSLLENKDSRLLPYRTSALQLSVLQALPALKNED